MNATATPRTTIRKAMISLALIALFAVPVAAVLNTVLLFFHGHDKFPDLGIDDRLTVRPTAEAELRARARALRRGTDDGPDYSAADEDDAAPTSHRGEA